MTINNHNRSILNLRVVKKTICALYFMKTLMSLTKLFIILNPQETLAVHKSFELSTSLAAIA